MLNWKTFFKAGFYGGLGFFVSAIVFSILYFLCMMAGMATLFAVGTAGAKSATVSAPTNLGSGKAFKDSIISSWTIDSLSQAGYAMRSTGTNEYDLKFEDGTVHLVVNAQGKIAGSSFR